jgi:hypothetical protein
MGKVLAIVFLIVFVWWAAPLFARGEWFAPSAIMPGSWMADSLSVDDRELLSTPPEGYGVGHFDFWNGHSGKLRSATRDDFRLRDPRD